MEYDLAFVGNGNQEKNRQRLVPLFREYKTHLVGPGWPLGLAKGEWCRWEVMPRIWDSAKIVPYSHYNDMASNGFVAEAALDVIVNLRS